MRKAAGWAVLMLGTTGLGWWAHGHNAKTIEQQVSAAAREVATGSVHDVEVRVSGRDITLSGLADTRQEQDALVAALNEIEGRRVVHADELAILQVSEPYVFEADKTEELVSGKGVAPTSVALAAMSQVVPEAELELAHGAPAGWVDAVSAGARALMPLNTGHLDVTDTAVVVTGQANSPTELAEVEAALSQLPEGFSSDHEIELVDDGAPASYVAQYSATTGLSVEGRVPEGASGESFGWALGVATTQDKATQDIAPEAVRAADLAQNDALMAAIAPQMKKIERMSLDVVGAMPADEGVSPIQADLKVEARPGMDADTVAADIASALPADLADSVTVTATTVGDIQSDVVTRENQITGLTEHLVDGRWVERAAPYMFSASAEDGALSAAEGHVPNNATRSEIGLLVNTDSLELAYGAPEDWNGAVVAGIEGLKALDRGKLEIMDQTLTLAGEAANPSVEAAAMQALTAVPEGFETSSDIKVLDDGESADFSVSYDASKAVRIEGRVPNGMTGFDVSDALGVDGVEDNSVEDLTVEGAEETKAKADAVLGTLKPWLPQVETFQIDVDGADSDAAAAARGVVALAPGADAELIGAALNDALEGDDVRIEVTAAEKLTGQEGARRINAATGETERVAGGFWVPVREFEATLETCSEQSEDVLGSYKIGFLSGSARLDAQAARSINALASVIGPCLDAGLIGELGGHTDSSGSQELNQTLSQSRAEAVRDALLARGLAADGLTAKGYGPDKPIADNGTEEGRAQNRRTEILWAAASQEFSSDAAEQSQTQDEAAGQAASSESTQSN